MVQFTDIHFGENEDNDIQAQNLMRNVIELEKPDLAIVTGDVVSGYAWDGKTPGWYAKHYDKLAQVMKDKNMYWAMTAGNHDTQADLNRQQVSDLDRTYDLSITKPNARNLSHAFNYLHEVYDAEGNEP